MLILGLIYGGYFCVYRRLWPLAISHAILDVLGFLLMNR
jgi:hypothetical protein